eukprot:scaffold322953_cov24-Tisochrysis_lutea.AAC.1
MHALGLIGATIQPQFLAIKAFTTDSHLPACPFRHLTSRDQYSDLLYKLGLHNMEEGHRVVLLFIVFIAVLVHAYTWLGVRRRGWGLEAKRDSKQADQRPEKCLPAFDIKTECAFPFTLSSTPQHVDADFW